MPDAERKQHALTVRRDKLRRLQPHPAARLAWTRSIPSARTERKEDVERPGTPPPSGRLLMNQDAGTEEPENRCRKQQGRCRRSPMPISLVHLPPRLRLTVNGGAACLRPAWLRVAHDAN